jgi:hypothetical protein
MRNLTLRLAGLAVAACAIAMLDGSAALAVPVTDWCVLDAFGANQLPCGVNGGDTFTGLDTTHFAGGTFTVDNSGNTDGAHINNVLAAINYETGTFQSLTAVANGLSGNGSGFTFIPNLSGHSFTWIYSGASTLSFLTVKAANSFVLYDIAGLTTGTVDYSAGHDCGTGPCLTTGNGGQVPDISHVDFWSANTPGPGPGPGPGPVPEPATLALLGAGLIGLGIMRRRGRRAS